MDIKLYFVALLLGFIQAGSIRGAGRIKYGSVVEQKYPYMAHLIAVLSRVETPMGTALSTYSCGGTVLNANWILTAAHCVYYRNMTRFPPNITTAFLNSNDATGGDQYQSDMMIPHPKYKGSEPPAYDNDIALIHFAGPLKVAEFVTLGPKIFNSDNINATVIGWGSMENGQGSPVLREANVMSVRKDQCPAIMYSWLYGKNKDGVRKTQICCPIDPIDSAQQFGEGDSGGPLLWWDDGSNSDEDHYATDDPIDYNNALVPSRKKRSYIGTQDPGKLYQVGLVSNHFGLKTTPERLYNLFTEISLYIDWIDETMAKYPEPND